MIKDKNFYDEMWNPITGSTGNWPTSYGSEYCNRFKGDVRFNINESDKILKVSELLYILENPFPSTVEKHYIDCPAGELPTFHKYRLEYLTAKFKTGRNILVCGMSEMFDCFIPDVWIKTVLQACVDNPQHNYIFLTTNYKRLVSFVESYPKLITKNMWFGLSLNEQMFNDEKTIKKIKEWDCKAHLFLYSDYPERWNTVFVKDMIKACAFSKISWMVINFENGFLKEYYDFFLETSFAYNVPLFVSHSSGILARETPKEFNQHIISEGRKKLRVAKCGHCKRELEKQFMHTIGSYVKRGEGYKVIGYLCDECYEEFKRQFKES